jgi:Rps23 Pro-64 3,4-dihydroxylase Tpa1-like proline 4-hydroxylase
MGKRDVAYVESMALSSDDATDLVTRLNGEVEWVESQSTRFTDTQGVKSLRHDLTEDHYLDLAGHLWQWATKINKAHWGFSITDWHQVLRAISYQRGDYHNWHMDYSPVDQSKLAFSVLLTDQFSGGELELLDIGYPLSNTVGMGLIFPGYHAHRVKRIRSGHRLVISGWLTGPRFR